ncbi:hypothetical protein MRX96_005446 [Rhipicephalus microplus]
MLLASKAFIELVANPMAGVWTARFGCRYLLALGDAILFLSSSRLAALAATFRGAERNQKLALALAAGALGVVVGYPLGGVLSDLCGTATAPLALLAGFCALATGTFFSTRFFSYSRRLGFFTMG